LASFSAHNCLYIKLVETSTRKDETISILSLIKKKKCGVKTLGGESLSNQLDRDRRIIFAYEVPVVCIPTTYTDNDTDFRA